MAKYADYGIAGGKNEGLLFRKGEPLRRVPSAELADELVHLIESEQNP